jgi:hypothetical protein
MTSEIAVKKSGQGPLHLRRYLGEPCPDLAPQWSSFGNKVLQGESGGLPRLSPMLRRYSGASGGTLVGLGHDSGQRASRAVFSCGPFSCRSDRITIAFRPTRDIPPYALTRLLD